MTDKAAAVSGAPAQSRWIATAAFAFIAVVALLAAIAGGPYLFQGASLSSEIAAQVRATTGLVLSSKGRSRFDLLPRPRIVMTELHFADPSGTLTVDADALEGDVRLLPLLVGRLELGSATLVRPKLAIDLDGRPMPPDSTIGRAMHAPEMPRPGDGQRLGVVTLVDGTAVLKSKALKRAPEFETIDVTIDWPDLDSPATLTGSLSIDKTPADVAAWIAQPSSLMRGEPTPVAVRVHSEPLDLSANGDLVGAAASSFHGSLTLQAPSLPALFARVGGATSPPPLEAVALNSTATITVDRAGVTSADLADLHLTLDGSAFEGTLAFQGGAKPALSGTLATDLLTLAPFLKRAPAVTDLDHQWSHEAATVTRGTPLDLDLRISATHLRVSHFTIDEAALAVMTRGDRTEVALVEGKAYGGDVKGRLSIGVAGGGVNLRGVTTIAGADAATLTWDAFGRQVAAGTLSGSANLETSGDSPAALMRHLQGWAKASASDGELSGADVARGLHEIAANRLEAGLAALRGGRTPFQSLAVTLRLADGIAFVEEASLKDTVSSVAVTGTADIGARGLALQAIASVPPAGTEPPAPQLSLDIEGSFDRIMVTPEIVRATAAPATPPR